MVFFFGEGDTQFRSSVAHEHIHTHIDTEPIRLTKFFFFLSIHFNFGFENVERGSSTRPSHSLMFIAPHVYVFGLYISVSVRLVKYLCSINEKNGEND